MTNMQFLFSGFVFGAFAGGSAFLWVTFGDGVAMRYMTGMLMQCF